MANKMILASWILIRNIYLYFFVLLVLKIIFFNHSSGHKLDFILQIFNSYN